MYRAFIGKDTGKLTINKKPSLMSNIIDRLRLAKLDPKHRKLAKYELEDEHQKPTQLAIEMMMQDLFEETWATKRTEYIDALAKMEKEEKADRGCGKNK